MNKFTYELIETVNPLTSEILQNVMRSDGALIPVDPANSDYQAYLKSLETDN